MSRKISTYKASRILKLYAFKDLSKYKIATMLNISQDTVHRYIYYYEQSDITYIDLLKYSDNALIDIVYPKQSSLVNKEKYEKLIKSFPEIQRRIRIENANLKQVWSEYIQEEPSGYKYSCFVSKYNVWCRENDNIIKPNKWRINYISKNDLKILHDWSLSTDRSKWEKAVVFLGLHKGEYISELSKKIERSPNTIKKWIATFKEKGLSNIDLRRIKKTSDELDGKIEKKTNQVIKLLHEPPTLHNINRTSWSLETLSKAYKAQYGETISTSSISKYIRAKGYSFKKAKTVLTSPDPDYRHKLNNIKKILSELKKNEKFFSIDEYGPFAIKIRGGRSYTPKNQIKTVPQYQISKGSLICTAALELSKNQITHFYSTKKNTSEMIKLLMILLDKYKTEERIFFSWDAASWHASKQLYKKVEEVNQPKYRKSNKTPFVELAPLPAQAQFLNVIESVFSGMAKAIIHNSNYQSIEECKKAIDRYFDERNKEFIKNPKRAGKKIWGKEVVKPVFKDSNTCKDSKYR